MHTRVELGHDFVRLMPNSMLQVRTPLGLDEVKPITAVRSQDTD